MQYNLAIPACVTDASPGITLIDYHDQAVIYHDGGRMSSVWIVKQGYLKIQRLSVQGRQATLSVLGSAAILGALVPGQELSGEMASAQGQAQVYKINLVTFDELMCANVEFPRFVACSLSARSEALQRRLFFVMHRKVESRLAGILSDLVRIEGEPCCHGCDVDVRLTQQDLADMVGASRQVVSATLNRFREQHFIQYSRDFICVCNLPALAALAEN